MMRLLGSYLLLKVLILFPINQLYANSENTITAHFIDVGQADATLIEYKCGAFLIDAGSGGMARTSQLIDYLDDFFAYRKDLDNTIEAVLVTHYHFDHYQAIPALLDRYSVKHVVGNQHFPQVAPFFRIRNAIDSSSSTEFRSVTNEDISTDNPADIFNQLPSLEKCDSATPIVQILASNRLERPASWTFRNFDDQNNSSLVIKVSIGASSILFTGDSEQPAIESLLSTYKDSTILDVDVYQVGFHGSRNGTTEELLKAMSPEYSVISVGPADRNRGESIAIRYGHPNVEIVNMLGRYSNSEEPIQTVNVASRANDFQNVIVNRNVLATAWQGTVRIDLSESGKVAHLTSDFEGRERLSGYEIRLMLENHRIWFASGREEGEQADFSNKDLSYVDFSGEDLSYVKFDGANLSGVNFHDSILTNVTFEGASVEDANFSGAFFEPTSLPNIVSMSSVTGLDSLVYSHQAQLVALRNEFRRNGFDQKDREITHSLNHISEIETLEDFFRVFLFQWTTNWGLTPGKPIALILLFVILCVPIYSIALLVGSDSHGIWKVWSDEPVRVANEKNMAVLVSPQNFKIIGWATYFSLLSSFNIGWREINIGNWLSRLQFSDYILKGTGIIRTLSGLQSVLSVIFLALSILTYFSHPFG